MVLVAGIPFPGSPVAAAVAPATITLDDPTRPCAGVGATLTWSPPDGVTDVTGYEIDRFLATGGVPQTGRLRFGPETTSHRFTMPRGILTFQIYAVTPAGRAALPYTSTTLEGNIPPAAASWAWFDAPSAVGDHSATVSFRWFSPDTWQSAGGSLPATVQVSASSGGASQWAFLPPRWEGATFTFGGLPNGVPVTFSAVTSNACESSDTDVSAPYVPGIPVAFTAATPPLTLSPNRFYRYRFRASGDPAPTYRLVDAPAWLKVGRDGTVAGRVPRGTTSFTYSVAATNRVAAPFAQPVKVAGPFTVKLVRPGTKSAALAKRRF